MKKIFIILFFTIHYSLLTIHFSFAQDTLLLMNGKKKIIKVVSMDENSLNYRIIRNKKKLSGERFIDKSDVYSLNYANGKKKIIYTDTGTFYSDTINDYYLAKTLVNKDIYRLINHDLYKLSRNALISYVNGEQYAIKNYKPRIVTIGGVASGLMGGYLAFFGLLIPSAYIAGASSQSPDIRNIDGKLTIPADKVNDTFFKRGYKDKARKIDFKRSFFGGLAGFTTMVIVKTLYSAHKL